jgi:uncharacterized protein (DUF2267 family)
MTDLFKNHCQKANHFINDLALLLGRPDDSDHALRVLGSVLHALRKKITVFDSLHIISQLPLILKGIYADGWELDQPLSDAETIDEFLELIRNFTAKSKIDFANDEEAKEKIRIVFFALRQYVSEDELDHVRDELPREIAEMV